VRSHDDLHFAGQWLHAAFLDNRGRLNNARWQVRWKQPWKGKGPDMAYVITAPCLGYKDTACVDACPVDCIHPTKDEPAFAIVRQLYIDPVECIDCGACESACPVQAIFALEDVPEKWKRFIAINAGHFNS